MQKIKPYWPLILGLALIKFLLPFFLQSPVYELHRDEYLYYQQGQHLALGYLENPPLLSYMGWISSLFGGSFIAIKFWPAFVGALTLIITCLTTAELGGRRFAQLIAGLGILSGAFLRTHFLFQQNSLDILSWTASFYFIIRYINTSQVKFIYALAIALAVGCWSKYSIMFMMAGILVGLLLTKHRRLFLSKHFWLAAAVALVLISPNVYWQYQHNWPLLHHMKELRETQLDYISPLDFLLEQVKMLLPMAPVWIAGLIWVFRRKEYRIIGFIYITIIALLLSGSGKGYYALGAYPVLFAAGAVAWQWIADPRPWVRYVLAGFILVMFYLLLPILLPIWNPDKLAAFNKKYGNENKWEDQKKHEISQDFADMLGWRELANKAENFYTSLPDSIRTATIVLAGNYGQAGALKYYSQNAEFSRRTISTNGSFLLWMPEQVSFQHILLVSDQVPEDEPLFQQFQTVSVIDSVQEPYSRQFSNKIIFYQNANEGVPEMASQRLQELKDKFRRPGSRE